MRLIFCQVSDNRTAGISLLDSDAYCEDSVLSKQSAAVTSLGSDLVALSHCDLRANRGLLSSESCSGGYFARNSLSDVEQAMELASTFCGEWNQCSGMDGGIQKQLSNARKRSLGDDSALEVTTCSKIPKIEPMLTCGFIC